MSSRLGGLVTAMKVQQLIFRFHEVQPVSQSRMAVSIKSGSFSWVSIAPLFGVCIKVLDLWKLPCQAMIAPS